MLKSIYFGINNGFLFLIDKQHTFKKHPINTNVIQKNIIHTMILLSIINIFYNIFIY
jgi:hypothetical protein